MLAVHLYVVVSVCVCVGFSCLFAVSTCHCMCVRFLSLVNSTSSAIKCYD